MKFLARNKGKILIFLVITGALIFALYSCGKAPDAPQEMAVTDAQEVIEQGDISMPYETEAPQETEETEEKAPPTPQDTENAELSCTLSVSCNTIFDNIDKFDGKRELLGNGTLFPETKVEFNDGESVFDVLLRVMRENKIHMEFVNTPVYGSVYIEGIGNIYEFDCGELSGWMYRVNGEFPNFGCSKYILKNGDKVEFVYTCDLGKDVGGGYNQNNGG